MRPEKYNIDEASKKTKQDLVNEIMSLTDKAYTTKVGGGYFLNEIQDSDIIKVLMDMETKDLENLEQEMIGLIKYTSKLKMLGVVIDIRLQVHSSYGIRAVLYGIDVLSGKEGYCIECSSINNGNIKVSSSLNITSNDRKYKLDISGLNMKLQDIYFIKNVTDYMSASYNYHELFPNLSTIWLRNSYNVVKYDLKAIDSLILRVQELVNSPFELFGYNLSAVFEILKNLISIKIGYGCTVDYELGTETRTLYNAIERYDSTCAHFRKIYYVTEKGYSKLAQESVIETINLLCCMGLDKIKIKNPENKGDTIEYTDEYKKYIEKFPRYLRNMMIYIGLTEK